MACTPCTQINDLESRITAQVKIIIRAVYDINAEAIRDHNSHLKMYAATRRIPIIGELFGYIVDQPEPKLNFPFGESWYAQAEKEIAKTVRNAETLKNEDIVHWKHEEVRPFHPDDYGGYYTPELCTREEALRNGWRIDRPEHRVARMVVDAVYTHILVMRTSTKEAVPHKEILFTRSGRGNIVYE